jgi:polyhydroxyalkanoate synthesis regulator phasin
MSPSLPRGTEEQVRERLDSLRDLALLPARLIQETLDDAVARGRMTREDATELAGRLLDVGRRQTGQLIEEIEGALKSASSDDLRARLQREVERLRRAIGVGSTFPIAGYDDLTAAQVNERLGSLTAPQLRKVRDHETRHRARKTVLETIAKRLGLEG